MVFQVKTTLDSIRPMLESIIFTSKTPSYQLGYVSASISISRISFADAWMKISLCTKNCAFWGMYFSGQLIR
jgi:hypothetical protein